MSGSIQTTVGSPPTTSTRSLRLRLGSGVVALLFILALIFWAKKTTWQSVSEVQHELASVRTESFQLGIYFQRGLATLNSDLLRFQFSDAVAARESFHRESRQLTERLAATKPILATQREKDLAASLESAFNQYLLDTAPLTEAPLRPLKRETVAAVQLQVLQAAEPPLRISEQLLAEQRASLEQCFASASASLGSLRQLLQFSTILLLLLLAAMTVLAYRVVIVPLRHRLSQSQAIVERQQKLASLGVLAAGVAHEIRNPLTAIKFRLFSFSKELPAPLSEHEDLVVINGQIDRLERIVQDFLQFARPSEPELAPVEAAAIVREMAELLENPLGRRGIQLKVEAAENVRLRADKQQLQQVLLNLVQNGADSINGAGTIHLRVKSGMAKLDDRLGPVVLFEVADTGKGIPPDAEQRIFDPFFSTKEGGTGLGLPIAARIAENHGGVLQYQSQRNAGTTFTLVLPRIADEGGHSPH